MYELKTRTVEMDGCSPVEITSAYTLAGEYIGDENWAKQFVERGIVPQTRDGAENVCSIGFCEAEQKWYGWSHRAMFGFGIGSEVKKGACGYQPTDEADFIEDSLRFWSGDEYHETTWAERAEDDGEPGVWIKWTYSQSVPNESLRGAEGGTFYAFPSEYGRGEWTAQTLEDAKQMACDFAEGVS